MTQLLVQGGLVVFDADEVVAAFLLHDDASVLVVGVEGVEADGDVVQSDFVAAQQFARAGLLAARFGGGGNGVTSAGGGAGGLGKRGVDGGRRQRI